MALLLTSSCGARSALESQSLYGSDGFAVGTTGGGDAPIQVVSSLEDSGPGTLREAAQKPGPGRIQFKVSGTIELTEPILVESNKTIDGRGAAVTIANDGLQIAGERNIIISDLKFAGQRGPTTDGIQIRDGARLVWVTHCEFTDGEDGAVDITRGATKVTVSWSNFHDFDKVMLIAGDEVSPKPRVTLHHNLFENTRQRNPRAVKALVDVYNNYLTHWTGIGMQAAEGSEINSERNVLEAGTDLDGIISRGLRQGAVRSTDDLTLNGAQITERDPETVFKPPYDRMVKPADRTLMTAIKSGAGPR